jgi:hypothetical protein
MCRFRRSEGEVHTDNASACQRHCPLDSQLKHGWSAPHEALFTCVLTVLPSMALHNSPTFGRACIRTNCRIVVRREKNVFFELKQRLD